jgi:hypothetical protein
MKKLELQKLIREEVKKTLHEGALLNAIEQRNTGLQGESKTAVQKLESYLETLGAKLDYEKLAYIVQDVIDAAMTDYEMLRKR